MALPLSPALSGVLINIMVDETKSNTTHPDLRHTFLFIAKFSKPMGRTCPRMTNQNFVIFHEFNTQSRFQTLIIHGQATKAKLVCQEPRRNRPQTGDQVYFTKPTEAWVAYCYSAQISIGFIAYIFPFLRPRWVGWETCNGRMGLLPSTNVIVIRMNLHQNTIEFLASLVWVLNWGSVGMATLEALLWDW